MDTESNVLQKGHLVGRRWQVIDQLGEGAMGMVYRARDIHKKRDVALKVLKPEFGGDEEVSGRFNREMMLSIRIQHPNTVLVHDVGSSDGQLYLAMELLDGTSLEELMVEEGPLDPGRVARLGAMIARGLEAAHQTGIIHRDLKPENVMVCIDRDDGLEVAKVLDFGLSRDADAKSDLTAAGVRVGTPIYMAPEYIENFHCDHRADLYALGVILYEMATDEVPFHGKPYEVLKKALDEPPPDPRSFSDVPDWLAEVILALLQKDPEARPQQAGEVAERLETHAHNPVGSRRIFKALALGVGLGLVVVVVLGTVLMLLMSVLLS